VISPGKNVGQVGAQLSIPLLGMLQSRKPSYPNPSPQPHPLGAVGFVAFVLANQ